MNLLTATLAAAALAVSVQAGVPALYIYGDVSDDGDIPSGGKEPFHQMRLNDTERLGMSEFKEAIEKIGLELTEK